MRAPSPAADDTHPVVEARGLFRRFGAVQALAGLSFAVGRGELFGLVGPDGAGKSTAIHVFTGLLVADAGEARVLGRDPARGGTELREAVGLMPQQFSLYRDLTVSENLQFFGRLHGLTRAEFRRRADRLLGITRLGPFGDRRADALSGGMYKKLALACALLHEPEVLFLDEPTNGVDPVSRRELWHLLHEFVNAGMTVILSTPYMDEAERCDRVGLVHAGRLLLDGAPPALLAAFQDEVYEVEGGRRAELDALLEALPAVRASSPAGSRLRIAVAAGGGGEVAEAVAPLGARLHRGAPDFEDLFLSHLGGAEGGGRAP